MKIQLPEGRLEIWHIIYANHDIMVYTHMRRQHFIFIWTASRFELKKQQLIGIFSTQNACKILCKKTSKENTV